MKILALVLAGGKGARLHPLTVKHAKPALPFVNGYRIIDFVLSNLVNSGISSIYVLAQYKPHSLIEHLTAAWAPHFIGKDCFLRVILPGTTGGAGSFKGTADAVYQNLHLVERHQPDLVAVFAADHVYRMDVRQMADFHQKCDADASVAAVPVPIEKASSFGVMVTDHDGRVREFQEKPVKPAAIHADPDLAYVSMGNYLFSPGLLVELLEDACRRNGTDFGRHIMPQLAQDHRVMAYDFARNRIPGVQPYEERGYWRDIGTLDAYQAAQRDVMGPAPRFNLMNSAWPIRGGDIPRRRKMIGLAAGNDIRMMESKAGWPAPAARPSAGIGRGC
ncbi:MAG TPA: sugar phosphate nucleotidyltransferase [Burkholderiales bacterium]|nr:sugar phosphate nucleotidyltransferase [Burkholderiales bacterium]